MTTQPLPERNQAESQPLSPQVQLEKYMHQLGGDRATSGRWQTGANGFLATRFVETFLKCCLKEAKAARTRAAAYGSAWALLDDDKVVCQAGLDALFYLINDARDGKPLSRTAAALGRRMEMVMFLLHPRWGKSYHLDGLRLANGRNLGVKPLLQRLSAKGFKLAASYRPLPAIERRALGELFIEMVRASTGMFTIEKQFIKGRTTQTLVMSQMYWDFLRQWRKNLLLFRPSKMPMVEPPRPWTDQYDGGFHTFSTAAIDIPPERWALATKHMKPCVLGSLNALQATPLEWNHDMVRLEAALFDLNHSVGKLPPRDRLAYPMKAEYLTKGTGTSLVDYWDDVWKWKTDKRKNTLRTDFIHSQVTHSRLAKESPLWFTWRMDRRGRVHQDGGNVGYHKSDPWRSQWQGTQPARISGNEDEFAWAMGDAWGLPKDWGERTTWLAEHEMYVIAAGREPLAHLGFWEGAKHPFRFVALCKEWAAYEDNVEHETKLLFQLDQTCSAYGHAACLMGDQWLAEQTNVIGNSPSDLYESLRAATLSMMNMPEECGPETHREKECLGWWNEHGVSRALIKEAVMPVLYGRSHQTLLAGINNYLRDELSGFIDREADNLRAFDLSICLAKYIHRAVKGMIASVGWLSQWLREVAKKQMDKGHRPYWLTPNGLLVESYSGAAKTEKFELVLSGRTVRMQCDDREGQPLDRRRSLTKLAADYVHSQDAAFLQQFVHHWANTYKHPIVTVHDCMATTLDKVAMMRDELQDQFARFYAVDHLDVMHYNLERDLGIDLVRPPKIGDLDKNRIGENPFLFG